MRQVGLMLAFAVATLAGSIAVALMLKQFFSFSGSSLSGRACLSEVGRVDAMAGHLVIKRFSGNLQKPDRLDN